MLPPGNEPSRGASLRSKISLLSVCLLSFWGGGCAATQSESVEAPSSAPSPREMDQALADYAEPEATGASSSFTPPSSSSRTLSEPAPTASRFEVKRIVTAESPPPHAGTRRRIDVKLRRADLQEALRFLAHAGGFNLVIGAGVAGEVTAELKRVTPYDALQVIARAHGARVVHTHPAGGSSIVLVEPDR